MKFDENGNLIPQKVRVKGGHDERMEELIEKYISEKCNFRINYDKNGEAEINAK